MALNAALEGPLFHGCTGSIFRLKEPSRLSVEGPSGFRLQAIFHVCIGAVFRGLTDRSYRTMTDNQSNLAGPGAPPEASESFYASALPRIRNFMLVLGPLLSAAALWKFGGRAAVGFALGCIIAFLNFHWLKSGVSGLADRVTSSGKAQSGTGIVARFLLRYVLLGLAAYAILTSFPASLRGLLAGLFLPVGAIACEAVYEVYVALTREI